MSTTTIRVQTSTRDAIRRLSEARSQTADTVIQQALQALEWQDLRAQAAREAASIRADPREQQLAREVAEDMDSLDAW